MTLSCFEDLRIILLKVDVTFLPSFIPRSFGSVVKVEQPVITMAKSIAKSIKRAVAVTEQEETTVAMPKQLSLASARFPCLVSSNSIQQITREAAVG